MPLLVTFIAGRAGDWKIDHVDAVVGEGLTRAARLAVVEQPAGSGVVVPEGGLWRLSGTVSNPRYATAEELKSLGAVSPALGRETATQAALIPIRKTAEWWALGQDERRAIIEDRSQHIAKSMPHLPAVARRLHHARDLGEPFDFLTWFEFSPDYADAFEDLVHELRESEEWRYVEREVDIRLSRV